MRFIGFCLVNHTSNRSPAIGSRFTRSAPYPQHRRQHHNIISSKLGRPNDGDVSSWSYSICRSDQNYSFIIVDSVWLFTITGQSVYWQSIFQNSPDPTFVLLTYLWHAMYGWDEALEDLYVHICSLVSIKLFPCIILVDCNILRKPVSLTPRKCH